MKEIQDKTCIKFKIRTHQKNFIQFYKSHVCASHVGFQRGIQGFSISDQCLQSHSVILHLLMHSLGFWHEHTRADRDSHISIEWENLDPKFRCNYRKFRSLPFKALEYDPKSILHFPQTAFAKQGDQLVFRFIKSWPMARSSNERLQLSRLDVKRIIDKYDCHGRLWQKRGHTSSPSRVPFPEARLAGNFRGTPDSLHAFPTTELIRNETNPSRMTTTTITTTTTTTTTTRHLYPKSEAATSNCGTSKRHGFTYILCMFLLIYVTPVSKF